MSGDAPPKTPQIEQGQSGVTGADAQLTQFKMTFWKEVLLDLTGALKSGCSSLLIFMVAIALGAWAAIILMEDNPPEHAVKAAESVFSGLVPAITTAIGFVLRGASAVEPKKQ